jgi:hypothetical protein
MRNRLLGASFSFFEPGKRFKVALAFEVVAQLPVALRWELCDGDIEPGGCRLETLEMSLRVAIAKLVVRNHAKPFPEGIAQF